MLINFSSDFIIFNLLPSTLSPVLNGLIYLFVLLPVVGWVGDSLLGRYRSIIAGFFLMTVAFLIFLSAVVMSQFNQTQIPATIMLCLSQLMALFGLGSIYTNMLPFMIDQMIGASADDISAAVQWNFWIFAIGSFTQGLAFLPIPQLQNNLPVLYIILNFLGLSVVLITDCLFHTWFEQFQKQQSFENYFPSPQLCP